MHTTVPQNFTKIGKIRNYLNWNLKKYYLCSIITLIEEIMKQMKSWMLAAILLCGAACVTSCNGNAKINMVDADTSEVVEIKDMDALKPVLEQYMVDSIGAQYAKGEICIPWATIIGADQSNPDSLLVWGDFWVFNYNQVGDTLKCVSGGSHPGMMVFQKNEKGEYVVTMFDRVEDGAGNLASAKRIFGESMYDQFHNINSNEELREQARAGSIADYVKEHKLPVKFYQDYGWPAKEIPAE